MIGRKRTYEVLCVRMANNRIRSSIFKFKGSQLRVIKAHMILFFCIALKSSRTGNALNFIE